MVCPADHELAPFAAVLDPGDGLLGCSLRQRVAPELLEGAGIRNGETSAAVGSGELLSKLSAINAPDARASRNEFSISFWR